MFYYVLRIYLDDRVVNYYALVFYEMPLYHLMASSGGHKTLYLRRVRVMLVIASVLFKVADDLHDFLFPSETFLSRLMRLSSFPRGLIG